MHRRTGLRALTALALLAMTTRAAIGQEKTDVRHAIIGEASLRTPEISTWELEKILADRTAVVFDARPFREFAVSHIPGARSLSQKPGVPVSLYVSDAVEVGRAVGGDKGAPVVLYCNGPFCG